MQLVDLYLETLARCSPERLIASCDTTGLPRNVVAIGKCAGSLLDGLGLAENAFVAMPDGYREPRTRADVRKGGHPDMTPASFAAGRALIEFVDAHDDVTFLISGGGSACVDVPLAPFTEEQLIDVNRKLVDSGVPIGEINCVRKHLSAIKGGRLGQRVRGRAATLILSDVSTGALADVASGPTLADPTTREQAMAILRRIGISNLNVGEETPKEVRGEVTLIADNTTLVRTAARIANAAFIEEQIECDVAEAAAMLVRRMNEMREGEIVVAGGEPTVVKHGDGKGGRCSELAVRFALACDVPAYALFASSDGVDGNSGVAGVLVRTPAHLDRNRAEKELARSNSLFWSAAARPPLWEGGESLTSAAALQTIIIPPSGNNLRDLYILARG